MADQFRRLEAVEPFTRRRRFAPATLLSPVDTVSRRTASVSLPSTTRKITLETDFVDKIAQRLHVRSLVLARCGKTGWTHTESPDQEGVPFPTWGPDGSRYPEDCGVQTRVLDTSVRPQKTLSSRKSTSLRLDLR